MVAIGSQDPGLQSTSIDDVEVLFIVHDLPGDMMRSEQAKTPVKPGFIQPLDG